MLEVVFGRCKTRGMCEKAVDRYPSALEWVDWSVTPKMLKELKNRA